MTSTFPYSVCPSSLRSVLRLAAALAASAVVAGSAQAQTQSDQTIYDDRVTHFGSGLLSAGGGMLARGEDSDLRRHYLYVWDSSSGWQPHPQVPFFGPGAFVPTIAMDESHIAVLYRSSGASVSFSIYSWDASQVSLDSQSVVFADGPQGATIPAIDDNTLVYFRRIFEYDSQTQIWQEVASLTEPPSSSGFGSRVAVDGEVVAIAAPGDPQSPGKVFVYLRDPGNLLCPDLWCLWDELSAFYAQVGDEFGASLALDGDWLAVGAPRLEGLGVVELFGRDAGGHFTFRDMVSSGDFDSRFGHSVALSGVSLLVGAPETDWPTTTGARVMRCSRSQRWCQPISSILLSTSGPPSPSTDTAPWSVLPTLSTTRSSTAGRCWPTTVWPRCFATVLRAGARRHGAARSREPPRSVLVNRVHQGDSCYVARNMTTRASQRAKPR